MQNADTQAYIYITQRTVSFVKNTQNIACSSLAKCVSAKFIRADVKKILFATWPKNSPPPLPNKFRGLFRKKSFFLLFLTISQDYKHNNAPTFSPDVCGQVVDPPLQVAPGAVQFFLKNHDRWKIGAGQAIHQGQTDYWFQENLFTRK